MVKINRMRPVHPGEYLAEEIEAGEVTVDSLAEALGVDGEHLRAVIDEARDVDAELALRLSRYYGTSAEIWMDLQSLYSLKKKDEELGEVIDSQVKPRQRQGSGVAQVA